MKLTAQMIREAAASIDCMVEIEFCSYSGRGTQGKECAAIEVFDPADLVRFGMALAYVVTQHADPEFTLDGGEIDLIDDAISEFDTPSIASRGTGAVAYWPGVPFASDGADSDPTTPGRCGRPSD